MLFDERLPYRLAKIDTLCEAQHGDRSWGCEDLVRSCNSGQRSNGVEEGALCCRGIEETLSAFVLCILVLKGINSILSPLTIFFTIALFQGRVAVVIFYIYYKIREKYPLQLFIKFLIFFFEILIQNTIKKLYLFLKNKNLIVKI